MDKKLLEVKNQREKQSKQDKQKNNQENIPLVTIFKTKDNQIAVNHNPVIGGLMEALMYLRFGIDILNSKIIAIETLSLIEAKEKEKRIIRP